MRGYKVRMGEVEAALLACKGVEAAVALITEDLTGVQRLVVRLSVLGKAGQRDGSTMASRPPLIMEVVPLMVNLALL